jgi:hypothetical protein
MFSARIFPSPGFQVIPRYYEEAASRTRRHFEETKSPEGFHPAEMCHHVQRYAVRIHQGLSVQEMSKERALHHWNT